MRNVCVFCGSSKGDKDIYTQSAKRFGEIIAERNLELIYGGGKVGLMGVIADAVLEKGGRVTGIIPDFLSHKEIEHSGVTEMVHVNSMQERKKILFEISDSFVAMPGGFGTIDEIFEMLTLLQLGRHTKPIAILNIDGYYDKLWDFLEVMVKDGFVRDYHLRMIIKCDSVEEILDRMEGFIPPDPEQWLLKLGFENSPK